MEQVGFFFLNEVFSNFMSTLTVLESEHELIFEDFIGVFHRWLEKLSSTLLYQFLPLNSLTVTKIFIVVNEDLVQVVN